MAIAAIATDRVAMFDHKGWSKVLDQKSGKFYYWNSVNNEVQWHKPFEMDLDELDDVDDLVRGTGIESHDYKILEASDSKDVDDFFEGTEELANNIQLVRGVDSAVLHSLPRLHCPSDGTTAVPCTCFDPCSPCS